jgi:hypothetical protein
MEGNTVDRSKMALDSSKLLFKSQMEKPGESQLIHSAYPSETCLR